MSFTLTLARGPEHRELAQDLEDFGPAELGWHFGALEAACRLELAKTFAEQQKPGDALDQLRLAEEAVDRTRSSSLRASIEHYKQSLNSATT